MFLPWKICAGHDLSTHIFVRSSVRPIFNLFYFSNFRHLTGKRRGLVTRTWSRRILAFVQIQRICRTKRLGGFKEDEQRET